MDSIFYKPIWMNSPFAVLYPIISWVFMLFCTEVILMGPGDWSAPLGFSVRKILFVLSFILVGVSFISDRTIDLRDLKLFIYGIIFFYVFGLIVPSQYNVDAAYSFADLSPLAGLLFLPFFVGFYKKSGRWVKDRKLVSTALLLLALLHILLLVVGTLSRQMGEFAITTMQGIYEPGITAVNSKIAIGYTPDGIIRVQWGSSCLLLLGLYFGVGQLMEKKSIYHVFYILACCVAIYSTQSRGLFFSILLGLAHYMVFYYCLPLRRLNFSHYLVGLVVVLAAAMLILPFFSPEFLAYLGLSREGSDDERFLQIAPLMLNWMKHLFVGTGFGSAIDLVRSETAPYAYEVSVLSMLMKIGLIGLSSALILCSCLLTRCFNGLVLSKQKKKIVLIYTMVFVYVLASNTNPYISNFFGMLVFYCFSLELACHHKPV
jgi:hypothetical protein